MGKYQVLRTPTPNTPPVGLLEGELAVEMATPTRLWVGVPVGVDPSGMKLLASPSAPPTHIGDAPPATPIVSQLWWKSDIGKTFIFYNDGNSMQWVEI
jgi:hypothetical protein